MDATIETSQGDCVLDVTRDRHKICVPFQIKQYSCLVKQIKYWIWNMKYLFD